MKRKKTNEEEGFPSVEVLVEEGETDEGQRPDDGEHGEDSSGGLIESLSFKRSTGPLYHQMRVPPPSSARSRAPNTRLSDNWLFELCQFQFLFYRQAGGK